MNKKTPRTVRLEKRVSFWRGISVDLSREVKRLRKELHQYQTRLGVARARLQAGGAPK
jgi:hypothetical protein